MLSLLWFMATHPLDVMDCVVCAWREGRSYLRGRSTDAPRPLTFTERLEESRSQRQSGR